VVEAGFDQSADWEGFDKFEDLRSMDVEVAVCLSTWFFPSHLYWRSETCQWTASQWWIQEQTTDV